MLLLHRFFGKSESYFFFYYFSFPSLKPTKLFQAFSTLTPLPIFVSFVLTVWYLISWLVFSAFLSRSERYNVHKEYVAKFTLTTNELKKKQIKLKKKVRKFFTFALTGPKKAGSWKQRWIWVKTVFLQVVFSQTVLLQLRIKLPFVCGASILFFGVSSFVSSFPIFLSLTVFVLILVLPVLSISSISASAIPQILKQKLVAPFVYKPNELLYAPETNPNLSLIGTSETALKLKLKFDSHVLASPLSLNFPVVKYFVEVQPTGANQQAEWKLVLKGSTVVSENLLKFGGRKQYPLDEVFFSFVSLSFLLTSSSFHPFDVSVQAICILLALFCEVSPSPYKKSEAVVLLDDLNANTEYLVRIYGVNAFGKETAKVVETYKTKQKSQYRRIVCYYENPDANSNVVVTGIRFGKTMEDKDCEIAMRTLRR